MAAAPPRQPALSENNRYQIRTSSVCHLGTLEEECHFGPTTTTAQGCPIANHNPQLEIRSQPLDIVVGALPPVPPDDSAAVPADTHPMDAATTRSPEAAMKLVDTIITKSGSTYSLYRTATGDHVATPCGEPDMVLCTRETAAELRAFLAAHG